MTSNTAPPMVTLEDARQALESSTSMVFDIRESHEHAHGVAEGAKLIPMSQLGQRLAELPKPGEAPFLVICHTQNRSSNVVAQLRSMGYTNASYVHGGMSEWTRQAWPLVKP